MTSNPEKMDGHRDTGTDFVAAQVFPRLMKFGVQLENFKFKFVDPNFVGDPKYFLRYPF